MSLLTNQTMANGAESYFLRAGVPITTPVVFDGPVEFNGGIDGPVAFNGAVEFLDGLDVSGGTVTLTNGADMAVSGLVNMQGGAEISGGNLTISGGGAVLTMETGSISIGGNMHAGTADISGTLLVTGKPVAVPRLIPYVGVSGLSIPAAIGSTNITAAFSIVGGRTYRISAQLGLGTGDTGFNWVGLFVGTGDAALPSVELGRQVSGPNYDNGPHIYSALFKPTANSASCILTAVNTTVAPALLTLNGTNAAVNPGVLLEDLGVL